MPANLQSPISHKNMHKTEPTYQPFFSAADGLDENGRRWRLILGQTQQDEGQDAQPGDGEGPGDEQQSQSSLSEQDQAMDEALEALYGDSTGGDLSDSNPDIARWLGDIRTYFPAEVVQVMQQDALNKVMSPVTAALQKKDYGAAYKSIEEAMKSEAVWDNSGALNYMAWAISDPDAKIENRDAKLALKLAERANELEKGANPAVLDTLAWAYYHAGMKDKAIAAETKAIGMLSGDDKKQYEETLERLKK